MKKSNRYSLNDYKSLILDASVIISLHESDYGEQIIQSLPFALITTQDVRKELKKGMDKGHKTHEFLERMLEFGSLKLTELNSEEKKLRVELLDSALGSAVGEGEASVIAISKFMPLSEKCMPVIDDKKARKRVKNLMNGLDCGSTLDLFLHPLVLSEIGKEGVIKALCTTFENDQMIVSEDCCLGFVIGLIGKKRAQKYNLLNRQKTLSS